MKKLTNLLMAFILVLSCVLTACTNNCPPADVSDNNEQSNSTPSNENLSSDSASKNDIAEENYIETDIQLALGANHITLYGKYEYIIVNFDLGDGDYKISSDDSLIGVVNEEEFEESLDLVSDNEITFSGLNKNKLIAVKSRYKWDVATITVEAVTAEIKHTETFEELKNGEYKTDVDLLNAYYDYQQLTGEALYKNHDYCSCGSVEYNGWEYWQYGVNAGGVQVLDYLVEYNYAESAEQASEKYDSFTLDFRAPALYRWVKCFNITKEDLYKMRNQYIIDRYKLGDEQEYFDEDIFTTDRQIEILYGDYSPETIMKELKDYCAFYYDMKLYVMDDLVDRVSDELLWQMLQTDEMKIYLTDMQDLQKRGVDIGDEHTLGQLLNRIEALRAKMEAQ